MTPQEVALDEIAFDERGLVPVVVQEVETGQVLMLAYANEEAVLRTVEEGSAHFYSRSRQQLWKKGETSGNLQRVCGIAVDCDADALLYRVRAQGPACHTGETSCFYRQLAELTASPDALSVDTLGAFLCELFQVIEARRRELPAGSYVASLMQGEEMALLRKIGEEATEVLLAAVQPGQPGLVAEVADLWFHCLVVLSRYGLSLEDLKTELQARRG